MRETINTFQPSTSWITTGLLVLVITAFGIFAQTHASEPGPHLTEVRSDFSSHALQPPINCAGGTNTMNSITAQKIHYR